MRTGGIPILGNLHLRNRFFFEFETNLAIVQSIYSPWLILILRLNMKHLWEYHGIYGFNGIFDGKYDDDPEVEHRYEKNPIEIDDL